MYARFALLFLNEINLMKATVNFLIKNKYILYFCGCNKISTKMSDDTFVGLTGFLEYVVGDVVMVRRMICFEMIECEV